MRKISFIILLFGLLAFGIPSAGFGEDEKEEVIKLDDITVKGEGMPYSSVSGTVNVVDSKQQERFQAIIQNVEGLTLRLKPFNG